MSRTVCAIGVPSHIRFGTVSSAFDRFGEIKSASIDTIAKSHLPRVNYFIKFLQPFGAMRAVQERTILIEGAPVTIEMSWDRRDDLRQQIRGRGRGRGYCRGRNSYFLVRRGAHANRGRGAANAGAGRPTEEPPTTSNLSVEGLNDELDEYMAQGD